MGYSPGPSVFRRTTRSEQCKHVSPAIPNQSACGGSGMVQAEVRHGQEIRADLPGIRVEAMGRNWFIGKPNRHGVVFFPAPWDPSPSERPLRRVTECPYPTT